MNQELKPTDQFGTLKLVLERCSSMSMYVANEIDYLSIDFTTINLDKIIEFLKQERSALQHLMGLAQNVIEFTPEGLNSDPKINKHFFGNSNLFIRFFLLLSSA